MPETPHAIKILTFPEGVRKRPAMYFGPTEARGINAMIYELIANGIDLFLAGSATLIHVRTNDETIIVADDGPGLPFENIVSDGQTRVERYLTTRHNAPTADGHTPHIHILSGGLGLAIVNAASSHLLIESSDGAHLWRQSFGKGQILSKAVHEPTNRSRGTRIEVIPDPAIFLDRYVAMSEFRKTLFELVHLFPGLRVELNDERFYSPRGLLDLAHLFYKGRCHLCVEHFKTFAFHGKHEEVELQVAAIGETQGETEFVSWVNGGETIEGGTHVNGLKKAFSKVAWQPDVTLVHIVMHHPHYAGPSKGALASSEVTGISELVTSRRVG